MAAIQKIHETLQHYGRGLTQNFSVAEFSPAQAEDQLKGPTQTLLQQIGPALGFDVVARTEAKTELGVRPDIGVSVSKLLAGHVELKAPGKGVRPKNFASQHDRDQFKKLKDHPNLVYTDGNAWALYRKGALTGTVVSAAGDVRSDSSAAYNEANAAALEVLLRDLLGWEPIVPSTPRALAETLAPLTRLLRESVRTALTQSTSALAHLRDEWRDVFFPDADDAEFSDSYAQTLTMRFF